MEEIRTDDSKLVCKCDFEHGIVEIVRNGWLVSINMLNKEIVSQRKAGQKKTA